MNKQLKERKLILTPEYITILDLLSEKSKKRQKALDALIEKYKRLYPEILEN